MTCRALGFGFFDLGSVDVEGGAVGVEVGAGAPPAVDFAEDVGEEVEIDVGAFVGVGVEV